MINNFLLSIRQPALTPYALPSASPPRGFRERLTNIEYTIAARLEVLADISLGFGASETFNGRGYNSSGINIVYRVMCMELFFDKLATGEV